jgi:hypothetical protein
VIASYEKGLEKDFMTISPFALNLMIAITLQGELQLFSICFPKTISGGSRGASLMHLMGF